MIWLVDSINELGRKTGINLVHFDHRRSFISETKAIGEISPTRRCPFGGDDRKRCVRHDVTKPRREIGVPDAVKP